MGPKETRSIRLYFNDFEGILDKSGIVADRSALRKLPQAGIIHTVGGKQKQGKEPSGIQLVDGSTLSFTEQVEVQQGEIRIVNYTYRYLSKDNEFTFRYDKDTKFGGEDVVTKENGEVLWHPECHLHYLDKEDPRYKTHETNLEEILNFIKYSFLSETE